ncbi:hypothetical protein CRYUN_Cryun16bG0128200 [Craigia yunnanensis]
MGACWSNRIKSVSPSSTGVNSTSASRNGINLSGSSSRVSSASIQQTPRSEGEILQSANLKTFTFSELRTATRNFRPDSVIGEGGFGSVFKGWIDEHSLTATKPGTGIVIAVKRLNQEGFQGHKEWLAEIDYLGQFHHPNLVKLIGYCLEDEHRLLGGRTSHHFLGASGWRLHLVLRKDLPFFTMPKHVIYRDFKTSNILLDSNYNAKLSDFGLARDGPTGDRSHVSTRVMGTYGYAAPEYLATGHLTAKSDIYSFGVVLLEMLSGRRAIDKNRPSGQHNLVEWAKPYLTNKRRIFHVLDTRLLGQYSLNRAQKAANLALQCLAVEPKFRPSMDEVVTSLEQLQEPGDMSKSIQKERHVNAHNHSNGKETTYSKPSASPLHV